jgi:phosphotransacetylase
MIFAEGDDPRVLRAAVAYQRQGFGKALVVGREADVKDKLDRRGLGDAVRELEVVNAANTRHLETYKELPLPPPAAEGPRPRTSTASPRGTGMRFRR